MANPFDVRLATRSDEEQVAATITLAFSADPIVRWIFPNPLLRLRTFMKLVGLYGGRAVGRLEPGRLDVIAEHLLYFRDRIGKGHRTASLLGNPDQLFPESGGDADADVFEI